MRIIKLALLSIVFLFLIITGMSLLIPSQIRISKAINLPNNEDVVNALVRDTGNWHLWHPLFLENSGKGRPGIAIKPLQQNDSVVIKNVQLGTQAPVLNGWQLYHHTSTDSLTLQWFMDFKLAWYPWQKFGSLLYENTYGVMMQQGLQNIKEQMEQQRRF